MSTLKKSFIALLAIASITANAQDDRAKKILDDLSAKTKSYSTLKAEFSWTTEKKDKSKDTQTGKIQTKGAKYKLEITGHDIYCDGKTVWDFIKDANEVQIKDMEASSDDAITPTNIFTIYEKGYKYKFEGEDATTQTISLFPINPDKKKFHTIKLTIDKAKKQIMSVKVSMKDGSTQTFTIKSFLGNATLADSDFVFNPKAHPGVSVEDLR
jgi:outer membrane lipoprotein-sorting protein